MAIKKRYFTKNKEKIYHSVQDRRSIGNKSGKTREKEAKLPILKVEKEKAKNGNSSKLLQLPNISQNITDSSQKIKKNPFLVSSWRKGVLMSFYAVLAVVSIWQAVVFVQKAITLGKLMTQRETLMQEMKLWEGITQKYPTYRDAYFQAAVLAYRLKDMVKEEVFLGKTLELDPSFVPAQNLQKLSK